MEYLIFLSGVFLLLIGVFAADDLYGKAGSNVTLSCDVRRGQGYNSLTWAYICSNGTKVMYSSDITINWRLGELSTRLNVINNTATGEYNLLIADIRSSDEGQYQCAANVNGVLNTDSLNLYLITPPTDINISNVENNRLVGTEGQDLEISCTVNGKPAPNVTLKADDNILSSGKKIVQYRFIRIQRDKHLQTVTCKAINEAIATPVTKAVQIYLNLKPLQPIFNKQQISTDENTPLVVSCSSVGGRPAALFLWMIGLTNVTSSSLITQSTIQDDGTYHVTSQLQYSVDRSYNGQQITCTAVNVAGDYGNTGVLDVQYPPDISVSNITYNQDTVSRSLTCTAVGNPPLYTFNKWIHKSVYGVEIRELDGGQDGVLTLPGEKVSDRYQDSGEYVCTVSNGIKDKDGNLQQKGSGFVLVHATPIFTRNNTIIQYGEIEKTADINVYVYSVPKYTTIHWYKGNTPISASGRYTVSDTAAVVYDTFHGKSVLLDGYMITLRIANMEVSDFDSSYRMLISNGVSSAVEYSVKIESTSPPKTPENFTVVSSSSDSVMVKWIPGYNFRRDQTFVIEYREQGSKNWKTQMVPNQTMSNCQIYQLIGLLGGTHYELRIFAFNKFNNSLHTDPPEEINTLPPRDMPSSSQCSTGAVAGGLTALICVLVVIIAYFLVMIKRGHLLPRIQLKNSEKGKFNQPDESLHVDKNPIHHHSRKATTGQIGDPKSTENYDQLGIKDNPNTYEEIGNRRDLYKDNKPQGETYEMLGPKDLPNTYDMVEEKKGLRAEYSNLKV